MSSLFLSDRSLKTGDIIGSTPKQHTFQSKQQLHYDYYLNPQLMHIQNQNEKALQKQKEINEFRAQLSNRTVPARGGDLYKKYNYSTIFTSNNQNQSIANPYQVQTYQIGPQQQYQKAGIKQPSNIANFSQNFLDNIESVGKLQKDLLHQSSQPKLQFNQPQQSQFNLPVQNNFYSQNQIVSSPQQQQSKNFHNNLANFYRGTTPDASSIQNYQKCKLMLQREQIKNQLNKYQPSNKQQIYKNPNFQNNLQKFIDPDSTQQQQEQQLQPKNFQTKTPTQLEQITSKVSRLEQQLIPQTYQLNQPVKVQLASNKYTPNDISFMQQQQIGLQNNQFLLNANQLNGSNKNGMNRFGKGMKEIGY